MHSAETDVVYRRVLRENIGYKELDERQKEEKRVHDKNMSTCKCSYYPIQKENQSCCRTGDGIIVRREIGYTLPLASGEKESLLRFTIMYTLCRLFTLLTPRFHQRK